MENLTIFIRENDLHLMLLNKKLFNKASMSYTYKTLILLIVILISGCKNQPEQTGKIVFSSDAMSDFTVEDMVADSIIYSVTIVNTESLDSWNDYRLRNINRHKFIENIFENIYSGNLTAYNYHSDEPMTVDDLRNLESMPDFSRDRIEEIMFEETWLYSSTNNRFYKEVYSIVLAYALFTEAGERREGLKAAFRIKMNSKE